MVYVNKILLCATVFGCLLMNGCDARDSTSQSAETAEHHSDMIQIKEEAMRVNAAHILVITEEDALNILKDINEGKISFEDAAKKFSACPSGSNGGALGYFGRGMMVKEFEDAAFDNEVGVVQKPVKTQFGWHLIKIIDKKS